MSDRLNRESITAFFAGERPEDEPIRVLEESTDALIRSYLFFREDYFGLTGGKMKDDAAEHMRDLAAEVKRRGEYPLLVQAVARWQDERKEQWKQTLAGLDRKGAKS